jgi:hypothetical protein
VKTIAIIDPYQSGHHSTYLRLFARAILGLGHEVLAFCPDPQAARDWVADHAPQAQERFHAFEFQEPATRSWPFEKLQTVLNGISWWRSTGKALRQAQQLTGKKADLVFFTWLDSYLDSCQNRLLTDLVFPYDWTGLNFNCYEMRQNPDPTPLPFGFGAPEEPLRARHCRGVAILDGSFAPTLQARLPGKKVVVFPDVADAAPPDRDFPLLQQIIEKAGGRKIVSLLGGLARRKGIFTLLSAAQEMPDQECFFLFAGYLAEHAFSPEEVRTIRALESQPPENCCFHFDFIPGEAQFNALVDLSDVLFAAYEEFPHSSNLLTKAALFEKPLIVSKGFIMEERVAAFGMGECIEEGDVSHCIAAIRRLLIPGALGRDFPGYRKLHSEAQFCSSVEQLIKD